MSNPVRTVLAVGACKAARTALRVLHRGGTTTPGKVAMKVDSHILETVSRGMDIIVVTGTNGKTTTSNMLEHAMTAAGRQVLANRSGANLLPGVAAEFTAAATLTGRPTRPFAVIECDEAALKQVVPRIHPKVIVVTNLFRDQLDRYGEVMHTRDEIRKGIDQVPDALLCLNADDSLVASLALGAKNPVLWYGLNTPVGTQENVEISDARYCFRCGAEYAYDYHTYAHLGAFRCPRCGFRRMQPAVAVTRMGRLTPAGTDVELAFAAPQQPGKSEAAAPQQSGKPAAEAAPQQSGKPAAAETASAHIALPAVYNVYNALAAVAGYVAMGFRKEEILTSLADVQSSFGRMETFRLQGAEAQMILVKNPAGCNQALQYLASVGQDYQAVFCLNDRTADGHDISWIWDADFEQVAADAHMTHAYVMGDRAEDMLLRLKYAGADTKKLERVSGDAALVARLQESTLPVFILPNYTAMLSLRARLGAATGKEAFWKG